MLIALVSDLYLHLRLIQFTLQDGQISRENEDKNSPLSKFIQFYWLMVPETKSVALKNQAHFGNDCEYIPDSHPSRSTQEERKVVKDISSEAPTGQQKMVSLMVYSCSCSYSTLGTSRRAPSGVVPVASKMHKNSCGAFSYLF